MNRSLLAAGLGAFACVALASEVPLTLAEAQRLAVERSSRVAGQDASIAASREMATAAGHRPDPVLKAGIDNVPVTGPDRFSLGNDFMTMRRVGLMQELTSSDKLKLRSDRFELEAQKSAAQRNATIADIQRDSATAWLERFYAARASALVAEQVAAATLETQAAEGAFRGGRVNEASVFAARLALSSLEDRNAEARRREAAARIALARWIGGDAQRPLAQAPALDTTPVHGTHIATAVGSHPMIAVLASEERIAQTEARLAQAARHPDWSVEVSYANRGGGFSDMVSIGVSVPLPWDRGNRQDREVAAKLALADEARASREDAERSHAAEIESMLVEWDDDRARLRRFASQTIPLAHERAEASLTEYRGGRSTLADVLAARRSELDVRVQALQLELEAARLWAQLNFPVPDESVLPRHLVTVKEKP